MKKNLFVQPIVLIKIGNLLMKKIPPVETRYSYTCNKALHKTRRAKQKKINKNIQPFQHGRKEMKYFPDSWIDL